MEGALAVLLAGKGAALLGLGLGAGIAVLGGAKGIGALAAAAHEASARQPEVAGKVQTQMLIAGGMIEGATIISLLLIGYGIFVVSGLN
jgi:F-type H+-transporting ATPase subunit c